MVTQKFARLERFSAASALNPIQFKPIQVICIVKLLAEVFATRSNARWIGAPGAKGEAEAAGSYVGYQNGKQTVLDVRHLQCRRSQNGRWC